MEAKDHLTSGAYWGRLQEGAADGSIEVILTPKDNTEVGRLSGASTAPNFTGE
jgi:hypothetical protein